MNRITLILIALALVACTSAPTSQPTTTTVAPLLSSVVVISSTTTTTVQEATTTTVHQDARAVFFASVPPSYYEGISEDDIWTLITGVCVALQTHSPEEVIAQTLAETGYFDLTDLIGKLTELGTCDG